MANFNLNKAILGGRLVSDPELKTTQNGINVTTFTIAVNRKKSSQTGTTADFINVTVWRQTADFVCRYFKKGSSICVTGSIQTRNWTDNSGNKKYATEVVADEVYFVDSKNDNADFSGSSVQQDKNGSNNESNNNEPAFTNNSDDVPKFETITDDDDLPFWINWINYYTIMEIIYGKHRK